MRELAGEYDFVEINRRVKEFSRIMDDQAARLEFARRYEAMHNYIPMTRMLDKLFSKISSDYADGLSILGGRN